MKHKLLSVAVLVLAAGVAQQTAGAQMIIPFIAGGPAWGSGDISDAGSDMGWLGAAGIDYTLAAMPGAAIGLSAIYAHIPYSGSADDATNIPGLFADVGYAFGMKSPGRIKPYIRGGIGVMQHRYDPGNTNADDESETKLGAAVGCVTHNRRAIITSRCDSNPRTWTKGQRRKGCQRSCLGTVARGSAVL